MTAFDPQAGAIPPPRPPAGPVPPSPTQPVAYPPPSTDPMSAPPAPFSGPPGMYPVSPAAAEPGHRPRGALLVFGVAALALLIAVVSLVVAWRALDQARDAKQIALAAGGREPSGRASQAQGPVPTVSVPAEPPTAAAPTEASIDSAPSGTGAPSLDEHTVYTPKYERQALTLKAACSYEMYADLDEPRANVSNAGYDIALNGFCVNEPGYLSLGSGVEGSTSAEPGLTPHDCAERIRTAPLGSARIPARKGTAACLTTSFAEAQEKGDTQRLVFLEITGVAEDGAVTIRATAWDIPR